MTADTSSTLSDSYTALGCGLQWTNYQLPINVQGLEGGDYVPGVCGWMDPVRASYIKIGIASIVMVAALLFHKLIVIIWRFFSPNGSVILPPILAFPRLEIAIASTTIICYSQSVAVLLSTGEQIPLIIGCIAGIYFISLLCVFAFFCYIIVKYRSLIDSDEEEVVRSFLSLL